MAETPCQKCKRELAAAQRLIDAMEAGGQDQLRQIEESRRGALMARGVIEGLVIERDVAQARVAALEPALRDAIARLNAFLSAFEGDPDPSENDTKDLVVRLIGLLDG
jgi:hypothetical protein